MAAVAGTSGSFTTTSGTKTSTTTPAVGELIVIVVAHTGNTSATAPTDDNADGLGTYTLAQTSVKNASADTMHIWIRDALIGSATSTIFTTAPGASSGGGLRVIRISGMPAGRVGAAAKRQSAGQDNQGAASPAPAFAVAALTANLCCGAVFNATNPSGITAPASWSNAGADDGYNTPTTGLRAFARDSGETGTTITFGASASAFCSAILELDTSAVGGEDPFPYVGGGYYPTEG